jgi:hypothetical protein
MGIPGALYIGELLGAILMFAGFIRATTPMAVKRVPSWTSTLESGEKVEP